MVLSPDEHLNLRADIKATLQSLEARIKAGGNWRGAASVARELGEKLEALADLDARRGDARVRFQFPEDEAYNPVTVRAQRRHARRNVAPPPGQRLEVTEVKRDPPELGPG